MTVDYQIIGVILAILGQYTLMFAIYRDLRVIQTEFSLCKYHRSITEIGDSIRRGESAWSELK